MPTLQRIIALMGVSLARACCVRVFNLTRPAEAGNSTGEVIEHDFIEEILAWRKP